MPSTARRMPLRARSRAAAAPSAGGRRRAAQATVSALSSARRVKAVPPQTSQVPSDAGHLEGCRGSRSPQVGAGVAAGDARHHLGRIVHLQLDHVVAAAWRWPPASTSSASACGTVRGKPSRMKPLAPYRAAATRLGQHGDDDDGVGHQLAPLHDSRLRLQADRRCRTSPRPAACRRSRSARRPCAVLQAFRLGALAGPGRPQQDEVHRLFPVVAGRTAQRARGCPRPPRRALRISPSYWCCEKMRLDLRHRVHRHRDDDQQRSAAEVERHAVMG